MNRPRRVLLAALALALPQIRLSAQGGAEKLPTTVEFNRDIRPIMSNTCFKCHGPDIKNNKSDLRLDLSEVARTPRKDKAGHVSTPIVPGSAEKSEVWRRISATDATLVMPPKDTLHQLTARDKALFKRWIEQGAKYQPHWAYLAPVKNKPPTVQSPARVRNPVDAFVMATLDERGLTPSPEADRRTLIRRVSLDLTGLPPSPEEVAAFLADQAPDAYERVVDRLLASPHYGERMAVPWLDVVRFADSVGFHGDQQQNVFPYRDYVIDAFNRNKPFDQFTAEQLAGDLLPNATPEQQTATGFNRLNMVTREGGAQPKEYIAKYAADRVRTVSTAWLGSTMACCECHDHKFDPFKTKDFYAMSAYFADIKQWGVYQNYKYTPEPELAGFSNDYPFPPEIETVSPYLVQRAQRLRDQLAERIVEDSRGLLADAERMAAVKAWAAAVAPVLRADPAGWRVRTPASATPLAGSIAATVLPDASVRVSSQPSVGKKPAGKMPTDAIAVTLTGAGPIAALRLEALPDEAAEGLVIRGRRAGNEMPDAPDALDAGVFDLKLGLTLHRAGETKGTPLVIADGYAEGDNETYFNGYTEVTVEKGWRSSRRLVRQKQAAVYLLQHPVALAEGDRLEISVTSALVARVRLSSSPLGVRLPSDQLTPATLAAFAAEQPTDAQLTLMAAEYFKGTGIGAPAAEDAYADVLRRLRDIAECREGRAATVVTVATEPRTTRVLRRGDWQDEAGEVVLPAAPTFLTSPADAPAPNSSGATRKNRLDLAHWLTSRENPLTARTFMNRLWKQFFGTGLSVAVDDLGTQGEYPSHPELLDWLAVDFMDRRWDIKAMVRLLVTSATYRQSSKVRPELNDLDPQNRLLARQSPRRLDAEFVRDNALAASGLLSTDLGGPSVSPYQPEGYYAQLNFPLRDYQTDQDERQYRRGLYMHWQRTFLHPMLANFDAPSREECTATRNLSTTPQQALTLLNDPTFVEASRALAEQVIAQLPQSEKFDQRLDLAFQRVLARAPETRERASLTKFYDEQLTAFKSAPDEAKKFTSIGLHPAPAGLDRVELAAWTSVTRVILNLNETIVRY